MPPRDGAIASGAVSFKPSRYDGGGVRYLRFRAWLDSVANDAGGIGVIHYEEIRRHRRHRRRARLWRPARNADRRGARSVAIAYQGVPVGTIKRFIAGKGNADKDAVIAAVRARGFAPADDNEADALAILLWAIETQGGVR